MSVVTFPIPNIPVPDPDTIRAAINQVDERAKLLRQLLRLSLRLKLHLAANNQNQPVTKTRDEVAGV
jgi:hypothetical protein